MNELNENELYGLVLSAVKRGRWLAEEWDATGLVGKGPVRRPILQTLERLREGRVFEGEDENVITAMGDELRRALNDTRDGFGDAAMAYPTDEVVSFDKNVVALLNAMSAWKNLRNAKQSVADMIAASREIGRIFSSL